VWYEQHGSTADAIRHALAAEDFTRAANLVELAWPVIQRTRQEATALGWLKALPGDLFHSRPVLSIAYVGALLSNGELDGAEEYLRAAEMWVGSNAGRSETSEPKPAGPVVVDVEAFRGLPGAIAVYRAGLALVRGDVPATVTFARKALDIVPEDGHLWRGAAGALLGLASWRNGDLDAAYQAYANGMDHLWRAGNIADVIGGALALADIRIAQGHLHQAVQLYQQALQRGTKHGVPALRGTADMYVGLSDLARERNDLEAATQHLQQSRDLGEHMGFPQHQYRWRVVLARIRQAQGDLDGALALLEEAEHHYVSDFYPNARPVAAFATRVWIAQGRVDDALAWASGQGLSSADQLSYLREFEHITFARLLLARHELPEVMAFLERLLQAAERGGRTGSVIEILVLQALAEQENGDMLRALESLLRAVSQAEPEGYVRLFIDEGPPMAQLLTEASVRGIAPDYTSRLLAAGRSGARQQQDRTDALADVLSPRELDVLHLIIQGCSNREISDRLFLALDTVKGHNRRIFSKLQVESRTGAIARARELGLTEP
jgi:LuxR family maltose regulon positive regulatory protein